MVNTETHHWGLNPSASYLKAILLEEFATWPRLQQGLPTFLILVLIAKRRNIFPFSGFNPNAFQTQSTRTEPASHVYSGFSHFQEQFNKSQNTILRLYLDCKIITSILTLLVPFLSFPLHVATYPFLTSILFMDFNCCNHFHIPSDDFSLFIGACS